MAGIPQHQGRAEPKLGPSDSSDTIADQSDNHTTDSDSGGTGERITVGVVPDSEPHDERAPDTVVDARDAGLGGGLDQAEEAQLGVTDEELEEGLDEAVRKPKP